MEVKITSSTFSEKDNKIEISNNSNEIPKLKILLIYKIIIKILMKSIQMILNQNQNLKKLN